MAATMLPLVKAMRPRQWMKNLFVFAGLIFGAKFRDLDAVAVSVTAFAVFCLLSSTIYLVNDIVDRDRDRQHPRKRLRPIASGELSVKTATIAAIILSIGTLSFAFIFRQDFGYYCLGYWGMMLAYSFFLKHEVILDVFVIAAGFVLRAVSGAVVLDVSISPWLIMCTILLSLFLGFCKRRSEVLTVKGSGKAHRQTLEHYTTEFLDQMISAVTAATIVAYTLYAFQSDTASRHGGFIFTVPFVLYGVFRYLYLVYKLDQGGSPEQMIIEDKPLLVDMILWVALSAILILKT
ncbi:MAG: decaprenyl-phosphate phosphoribosyltransferase [Armatimonadota bacterium]